MGDERTMELEEDLRQLFQGFHEKIAASGVYSQTLLYLLAKDLDDFLAQCVQPSYGEKLAILAALGRRKLVQAPAHAVYRPYLDRWRDPTAGKDPNNSAEKPLDAGMPDRGLTVRAFLESQMAVDKVKAAVIDRTVENLEAEGYQYVGELKELTYDEVIGLEVPVFAAKKLQPHLKVLGKESAAVKLHRTLQNDCFLYFCVLEPTENIPATTSAVMEHKTASYISVPVGTSLIQCIDRMRLGYHAKVYFLNPDVGCWACVQPEHMDYRLEANDAFYFKLVIGSDPVDLSEKWARTVLQPFTYSVLELPGLRKALAEPLPLPLPVGDMTFRKLDPEVASNFVPFSAYPAEAISCYTTAFMKSKVTPEMSENMLQSIWDQAFGSLWLTLLSLVEVVSIRFNRNVVDKSGASNESVRPDLMLWFLNRLCVKFEEKRDNLFKALNDLSKKIGVLPLQYYGPVQWIIGVALARTDMAVWAMRHGHAPDELSGYLSMTSNADKATCLRLSINFLRVALSLTSTYSKLTYLPPPFTELEPCTYGSEEQITRRLRINYPKVVKVIEPWSEHVKEGFTTTDYVTKAYAVSNASQSGLVKGDLSVSRGDRYKVVLNPVGYEQLFTEEHELRVAIRDVLEGLQELHAAGLVHRDIRWKNVLKTWSGSWMLIDLETSWECDHKPLCRLRVWDDKTLIDGKYTVQSDLYLVGKLMFTLNNLSHAGNAFQYKLLQRVFTNAKEALADSYLCF